MNALAILALVVCCGRSGLGQLVGLHPPGVQEAAVSGFGQFAGPDYSHRAVLVNAAMEAQLPDQLKNPFYRNPRIAEALAKESWFGPGERPVSHREAEKIPRERIYSVLKNAGLARRRRR